VLDSLPRDTLSSANAAVAAPPILTNKRGQEKAGKNANVVDRIVLLSQQSARSAERLGAWAPVRGNEAAVCL